MPVSFFGFFEGITPEVEYVGLFAPPVVETQEYVKTTRLKGVKQSFDLKGEIDIVVTSLGSASHDHSTFNRFMSLGKKRSLTILDKAGHVGDVQYCAYSKEGPITEDAEIRCVTLLELEELVEMAADPDKHVVVVGGRCGHCDRSRIDAIRPLFDSPALKVWSHFVMDVDTARELLEKPPEAR